MLLYFSSIKRFTIKVISSTKSADASACIKVYGPAGAFTAASGFAAAMLEFEGKSYRLKEAASRIALNAAESH